MSQTFVVEVTEKPDATPEESIESLARAFNISSRKIELMLKRLPGVATKPISEQEASVVVTYFEQAGLKAIVKSVTVPSSAGASTSTAPAQPKAESPSVKPGEQSSSDIAKARLASVTAPEKTAPASEKVPAVVPAAQPVLSPAPSQQVATQTATQTLIPPPTPVEIPVVTPTLQPLDVAALLRSPSQPVPPAPPVSETRSEHDILRNTLIGEPDPRKTQVGQRTLSDIYKTSSLPKTTPNQNKLGNRLLLSAVLPTLLTLLGSLAVTYLMVQPALSEHLQNSSRHPAVAIASGLVSVAGKTPAGTVDYAGLQNSINATRAAFSNQDLHFIVITDSKGQILPASWFASSSFDGGTDLRTTIETQATTTLNDQTLVSSFAPLSTQTSLLSSNQLEIVSQPLRLENETVGAVVVGITGSTAQTNIWRVLGSVALLSLVPLALASLLAILAIRPITRRVAYLTQRANDISRGNLGESVELTGNDELSQLGEALERLRVSMQSALDRLRRRR
jgi:HAMP domain-containing protein